MQYSLGFKPTPARTKALFGAPHPSAPAAPFPPAVSLRDFAPSVLDQGPTSSCTGHATSVLIYVACAAASMPLDFVPSPLGIYTDARCEEVPGDEPLEDAGANIGDVMTAIAREGVRPMGPRPKDGRLSDVSPENVHARPTLAQDLESARHLVLGTELLASHAADFLQQIATSIANMHCGVNVGVHATPALQNWTRGMPALADVRGFADDDGHDMAVLAYRTEANGTLSFWLLSSWGSDYGEDGGLWVTGKWLVKSCLEAWRMRFAPRSGTKVAAKPPPPPPAPAPKKRYAGDGTGFRRAVAISASCALAMLACTPSSVTASRDAGAARGAAAACANLVKVGCALGRDAACVSRVELAVTENHTTAAKVACASSAPTKAALEACSPYFACP